MGQCLPARFVTDVGLPIERIRGRSGHHYFQGALGIVLVVPVRAQCGERSVQLYGDSAAHAHDHRFSVHRFEPPVKVCDDVLRDELDSVLSPHDGLKLCPLALEFLLPVDFFAFGDFIELGVNFRLLGLSKFQFSQAALVVDGHRCPVRDRTLDVVDADVIAEYRARVGVGLLDRGPGESNERGVG